MADEKFTSSYPRDDVVTPDDIQTITFKFDLDKISKAEIDQLRAELKQAIVRSEFKPELDRLLATEIATHWNHTDNDGWI